jgi:hypothetical protein
MTGPRPRIEIPLANNIAAPKSFVRIILNLAGFPDGPKLWAELHRRALASDGYNDSVWLAEFEKRILGNCACRAEWRRDLQSSPPDFSRYFEWTVDQHNKVNARLGKPVISYNDALLIWDQPIPI